MPGFLVPVTERVIHAIFKKLTEYCGLGNGFKIDALERSALILKPTLEPPNY